jgi:hypothetical protein
MKSKITPCVVRCPTMFPKRRITPEKPNVPQKVEMSASQATFPAPYRLMGSAGPSSFQGRLGPDVALHRSGAG